MKAPRQDIRMIIQSTMLARSDLSAFVATLLIGAVEGIAAVVISAHPHFDDTGHSWSNQLLKLAETIAVKYDLDGNALYDFREVARCIIGRQQCKRRTRCR